MPYLTDSGNAEALIEKYGDELCYCPDFKSWMVWTGKKWKEDVTDSIYSMARDIARSYAELAKADGMDAKSKARYLRHARASESLWGLKATITLARSIEGVCVDSSTFDRNPMLLNVDNGTLDLDSGEFRRYDRTDMITKCAPVTYVKGQQSEVWTRFMADVIPDASTRAFLQRAVGYSLTGRMDADVLFILHGGGRNGKTTFVNTILNMLGDYAAQSSPHILIHTKSNGPRDDLFVLMGKRFVAASETEETSKLDEVMVKQMTGGDRVSVNPKYRSQMEFCPTWKVWLSTNHEPTITGNDAAIWRRIIKIPFTEELMGDRCDPKLRPFLLSNYAERSGILNWALAGLEEWKQGGLAIPKSITKCTNEYHVRQDFIGQYISERCTITQNPNHVVMKRTLYEDYLGYARTNFETPISIKLFCTHVRRHGISDFREATSRYWLGIKINDHVSLSPHTFTET